MSDFKSFMSGRNLPANISIPTTPATGANQAFQQIVGNQSISTTRFLTNVTPWNSSNGTFSHENRKKYNIDFQPNILDNFDNYTYHWKLFITSLENASTGNILNTDNQTIIAESGVSDLTIDKVELEGVVGPSAEAGTGTMVRCKFEIVEPAGAGLIDKMFYQAISLGIGNWLVMPFFLQLEFRGRDPVTADSLTDGAPGPLSAYKWVWPIKITNTKANVTHVGTRYEFEAIMYDELAQANAYFSLQHSVTLDRFVTLEDAMKRLEKKLNEDQIIKLVDNYSIPDTYRIIVDPAIAKKNILPADGRKDTAQGGDYVKLDKKTATFAAGTGIDKIVDMLCGSMEYFQEKMQGSKTPNATPDPINQQQSQMRKMWRIITDTKPIAFDYLRQDNAVAITVYIVEYDLGAVDVVASQTGQTPDTKVSARKRLDTYLDNGILRKKYNYIFTGLNDQIYNLDLNMNFSYVAALARFGGIYYDYQKNAMGINAQEVSKEEEKISKQFRETLQFVNNSDDQQLNQKKLDELQNSVNSAKISDEYRNRLNNLIKYQRNPDKIAQGKYIAARGGLNFSGTLEENLNQAKGLAKPVSGINSNGEQINLQFVSDVDIYSPEAQQVKEERDSLAKKKLRPIAFREAPQERNLTSSIDSTSKAGRARTSSIFSTALYSHLDASLQSLKLTIKGDPFWLFPRNVGNNNLTSLYKSLTDPATAIKEIKQSHILYPESININSTDNFIIVRFRTPRVYNITDAPIDPNTEVNAFSGVYKVVYIKNRFESGRFSQELSCILDPVIELDDLAEFLKDIEESIKNPDPIIQAEQNPLSTRPIKEDRIKFGENLKGIGSNNFISGSNSLRQFENRISNIPTINNPTPGQIISQVEVAKRRGPTE